CLERRSLLFPTQFDTSAKLFADGSGGRSAPFDFFDVLAVALVWGAARSIWRQGSAGGRSPDRRRRIRAICEARYWRFVLDDILPRSSGAGARYGDQRRPADHDGDERY